MAQSIKVADTGSKSGQDANRLRDSFVALAESLLESIQEVFPECDETSTARRLFSAIVKGDSTAEDRFLRKCMDEIRSRQDRIKDRDIEALFEIADGLSILKTINLRQKWSDPDFSEESKGHLWQYVEALQTYGGLYCSVPTSVMAKIEKVAVNVSEKMAGGDFDLSKLDLSSLGKDLIGELSTDEVEEFQESLADVYSCVGNVASLLAKQSGNETFDVAAMMSCVQSMQSNVVQGGGGVPPNFGALLQNLGGEGACQNPMLQQALASLAQGALSSNLQIPQPPTTASGAITAPTEEDENNDGDDGGGPSSCGSKKRRKKAASS